MLTLHTNTKISDTNGKATTQLTGYDFNSYCQIGSSFFACSSVGIYKINSGNKYDTSNISSVISTFSTNLGFSALKRLRFIYLDVETTGQLKITTYADNVLAEVIIVTPGKQGRQYIRVSHSRASKGCYWSFKVENVAGCWFSLDILETLPVFLHRGRG